VLGGYDAVRERRDAFVYRPGSGAWRRVAPLPRPNHAFAAVAFRGEIWVIGGRSGERILRQVCIYDVQRDRWQKGPPLTSPMEFLGAAVVDDQIHAVSDRAHQVYDAGAGRWRDGPPLRVPRHALSLLAVSSRLYAIGGCRSPVLVDTQVVEALQLPATVHA
jgi:hypothetical protein